MPNRTEKLFSQPHDDAEVERFNKMCDAVELVVKAVLPQSFAFALVLAEEGSTIRALLTSERGSGECRALLQSGLAGIAASDAARTQKTEGNC